MAANVQNALGKTDWAEDSEPDLATSVPPPQVTKNKDGTETVSKIERNTVQPAPPQLDAATACVNTGPRSAYDPHFRSVK